MAVLMLLSVSSFAAKSIEKQKNNKNIAVGAIGDASGTVCTDCGDWDVVVYCASCTCNELTSIMTKITVMLNNLCDDDDDDGL